MSATPPPPASSPFGPAPPAPAWARLVFLPLLSTWIGSVLYATVAALGASFALLLTVFIAPSKIFARKNRDSLAQVLNDPARGTHGYLTTNGIKIHYVATGREGAPLLLFLHGFPEFWFSWHAQLRHFAQLGYRCVAIDMRGYGDSDKPQGLQNYNLKVLVGDVAGVIQGLGYQKAAAVVGHDWGAIVAFAFADQHPELLEKLAICNGPHPKLFSKNLVNYPQVLLSWYIYVFQFPHLPELLLRVFDYALIAKAFGLVNKERLTKEHVEFYKYAMSRPGATTSTVNYYRALVAYPPKWLTTVKVPTLLVWGKKEEFIRPETNHGLESVVPDITIKFIENCSHWPQADCPDELNAFVSEFLAQPRTN